MSSHFDHQKTKKSATYIHQEAEHKKKTQSHQSSADSSRKEPKSIMTQPHQRRYLTRAALREQIQVIEDSSDSVGVSSPPSSQSDQSDYPQRRESLPMSNASHVDLQETGSGHTFSTAIPLLYERIHNMGLDDAPCSVCVGRRKTLKEGMNKYSLIIIPPYRDPNVIQVLESTETTEDPPEVDEDRLIGGSFELEGPITYWDLEAYTEADTFGRLQSMLSNQLPARPSEVLVFHRSDEEE